MKKEEAIKILREVHDDSLFSVRNALETLIPELKESEDERILNGLIAAMKDQISCGGESYFGMPLKDILAYLEKQKEQIPYIDFVIKPHKGDDNNPYDMSVSEAQEYTMNRGFDIPWNDGDVFVDERYITQTVGNVLRWADEHPKEQKPTIWTEEDEKNLCDLLAYGELRLGLRRWVAGLPEKIKGLPQKPAEWSEEDEKKIEKAIWLIEHHATDGFNKELKEEVIEKLKSLRPQSHWKPSEEQMEALKNAAFGAVVNGDGPYLRQLYNELKKR